MAGKGRLKTGGKVAIIETIDLSKVTEYASQPIENYKIADALNISTTTFYKLLREEPTFKAAYEEGIANRKYELEKALYKRAEGFQVQEIQTTTDSEGKKTVKVTDKHYVPDAVSLIFALKNVYGEKFKDKVETTTNINVNIKQIETLSNEELLKITEGAEIQADYSIE